MRKIAGYLVKGLGLIAVVLIAALLGLGAGFAGYRKWWTDTSDDWEPVPLPGSRQPDHFVITPGPFVYVQSTSGVLLAQQAGESTWELVQDLAPEDDQLRLHGECQPESTDVASAWEYRPPGTIAQALECRYSTSAESGFMLRYVILTDGGIYRSFGGAHGLEALIRMVVYSLIGLLGGALVGGILYGLLLLLRR
jgi:hypothetical protein